MQTFTELFSDFRPDAAENSTLMILGSSVADIATAHGRGWLHWGDYLELSLKQLSRHATVLNKAIGGDTTLSVLRRFGRDVLPFHPRTTIFMIGGNDAHPYNQISAEGFCENLERICLQIQALGSAPILQSYYCPNIDGDPDDREHVDNTERNMEIMRQVAQKHDWLMIDPYPVFKQMYLTDPVQYRQLLCDNWHLGEAGNIALAKFIVQRMGLPMFPLNERLEAVWKPFASMLPA